MTTKKIKKIISTENGDNYVADIEDIENRITQNSSNLETAKQELSNKCDTTLSDAKAYTDQEKQKYIPLTGGKVENSYFESSDKSGVFCLEKKTGSSLFLFDVDSTNYMGGAILRTVDKDAQYKDLQIKNDGSFKWNGRNIVRSINGKLADSEGNIQVEVNASAITGEIKWFAQPEVPDGYLVCNGAEVSRETYADLFAVISTTFGKGDGTKATSKFGTAVFDGEDGNSIRVTVATNESDASSFDVSTFFKGSLVKTQTVKKSTELVNNLYVVWDTSVALVAGDDVTFTGGTGTTFNLPNLIDKFAQGGTTVGTVKNAGLPNIEGDTGVYTCGISYQYDPTGMAYKYREYWGYTTGSSAGGAAWWKFDASRSNSIYGNSTTVQPPALTLLPCIKY